MTPRSPRAEDFLTIGDRIRVLPVVHGSGDCAILVREELLARPYDCLAVPLPPSFQEDVEAAADDLPRISAVVRRDGEGYDPDRDPEDDVQAGFSYVPIDPCQPVIAGIRTALGERIPRAFIDLETARFEARNATYPDPYALKKVRPEAFAAAILPSIPPPTPGQHADRIAWMAHQLRRLEVDHRRILLVCSMMDWPWIRDAYNRRAPRPEPDPIETPVERFEVDPRTLAFLLGELPFLTSLYERGRIELTADDNLSVDGIKEMLVAARERLRRTLPKVARRITPHSLSLLLRYARNLTLMDRRLSPDLYTLVVAAQQTAGDDYALALAEAAREYPYMGHRPTRPPTNGARARRCGWGSGQAEVPGWGVATMASRLPGQAILWRNVRLRPRPPEREKRRWQQRWNPYGMCSWPPEDDRIESFHRHVRDQAKALSADLARSEKFTASVMDGLDIRETLRLVAHRRPLREGHAAGPRVDRMRRLPVRRPGRPRSVRPPGHLVCRASRRVDPGLFATDPMRTSSARASRGPNMAGPSSSSPGPCPISGGPAAELRPDPGRTPDRRRLPAQPGAVRGGRQPECAAGLLAAAGPPVRPEAGPHAPQAVRGAARRAPADLPRAQR
ncbi:MAG: hypothetical protein U0800_15215 [Isosphaeraceae bacterium]